MVCDFGCYSFNKPFAKIYKMLIGSRFMMMFRQMALLHSPDSVIILNKAEEKVVLIQDICSAAFLYAFSRGCCTRKMHKNQLADNGLV